MKTRKVGKLKLFVSGLILSLALGVVDYDILFLSDYDYSNCENKENTELVVTKTNEIQDNSDHFEFASIHNNICGSKRFLIYKLSVQLFNNKIITLLKLQNRKISNFRFSYLKSILLNSIFQANNFHHNHLPNSFVI